MLVPQLQISGSRISCSGVPGFLLQCFGTNVGSGGCRGEKEGAVFSVKKYSSICAKRPARMCFLTASHHREVRANIATGEPVEIISMIERQIICASSVATTMTLLMTVEDR